MEKSKDARRTVGKRQGEAAKSNHADENLLPEPVIPNVSHALNEQQTQIERLENALERLESTLHPILTPILDGEQVQLSEDANYITDSLVAARIKRGTSILCTLETRLYALIRRVEV